MRSRKIKQQQDRRASAPGFIAGGKISPIRPSKSQGPQNPDAAKFEKRPKETEEEYLEKIIRLMEEEDMFREEEHQNIKAKKQTEKEVEKRRAEAKRSTEARATSSQQNIDEPQTMTTASAGAQTSSTYKLDKKQSKRSPDYFWGGVFTDQAPLPPPELIAPKPCHSSSPFLRLRKTDFIENCLSDSPKMPLNDTAVMPAAQPKPKAAKVESEVEGEKSKDRKSSGRKDSRATTAEEAIANSGSVTEAEITIQKFEHVCENLKTYIEGMDTRWVTESEIKQTRFCLETMRAAAERVKKLSKHCLDQHDMAARVSSSLFTPSAIDSKNHYAAPSPSPSNREPCSQRLPCVTNPKKREPEKTPPIPVLEATSLGKSTSVQALPFFQGFFLT